MRLTSDEYRDLQHGCTARVGAKWGMPWSPAPLSSTFQKKMYKILFGFVVDFHATIYIHLSFVYCNTSHFIVHISSTLRIQNKPLFVQTRRLISRDLQAAIASSWIIEPKIWYFVLMAVLSFDISLNPSCFDDVRRRLCAWREKLVNTGRSLI